MNRGTNLYDAVVQTKKKLQKIHDILFVEKKLQELHLDLFSDYEKYYSVDSFIWIYQIFWSRALR